MKIRLIAGLIGFTILGLALGPNMFGHAAVAMAAIFGIGLFILWLQELKPKKDAYDLALLQQIHEKAERSKIDDELAEYDTTGKVICLNCMTEYDSKLGQCPRCGKSQF